MADEAPRPLKVLNLFGYTGGSTLAAAATGAELVHVDASKPTVEWARRNSKTSGLADASIRWIVDDVRDFVERELRRHAKYDLILLDPPAYGHGASGRDWKIERDIDPLIASCIQLLSNTRLECFLPVTAPSHLLRLAQSLRKPGKAFAQPSRNRLSIESASSISIAGNSTLVMPIGFGIVSRIKSRLSHNSFREPIQSALVFLSVYKECKCPRLP